MKRGEYIVSVRAERVTTARERKGLSKAALARAAGITPAYVTLIEQGRQKTVTSTVAAAIADALEEVAANIFEGFSGVAAAVVEVCTLTAEEKDRFAEENIGFVRCIAWENKGYFGLYGDAFEEAFSVALVVFAEVLNSFDPSKGRHIKTHIVYAIKNRFASELRKRTAAKRSGITYSLDAQRYDDGETDFYNYTPSRFSVEDTVIQREELREAVRQLTPSYIRNHKEVRELLACVGF